jgi:precorrin-6A/cobalt-precorrin-6A reductase
MPLRVLILGGTTEASALARLLTGDARFDATMSLAGRTKQPMAQSLATRIGGFGGIDGLARYIESEGVRAVVDATHPFADQISANAVAACTRTGTPLASLLRAPWIPQAGDRWHIVADTDEAAGAIGRTLQRVFLSLGRQELHAFAAAPQHRYVARVIDMPEWPNLPPNMKIIQARGPFDVSAERALLTDERIDVIVSKNAGGAATYAKIEAARDLGLLVIMIARPRKPAGHAVSSAEETIAWLAQHLHEEVPRSLRGV